MSETINCDNKVRDESPNAKLVSSSSQHWYTSQPNKTTYPGYKRLKASKP